MVNFYPLFLTLLMVATEGTTTVMYGSHDDDVTLLCGDFTGQPDETECYRGRWIKYLDNGQQDILDPRAKVVPGGDMALKLRKLRKSHEGLYSCEIWKGWDRVHISNTTLKFKECSTFGVVKALLGSSFDLECPVNTSSGAHSNISWSSLYAGEPGDVQHGRAEISGLVLHFHTVEDVDRKWYRCTYDLGGTRRCFEFKLEIKATATRESTQTPSTQAEEEVGNTAVVVPILTVTAALAVLIGLLVVRRYVYKRFAGQPASKQPDNIHDYESIDLQPTEESHIQDGTYSFCQQESGFNDNSQGNIPDDQPQEENAYSSMIKNAETCPY